MTDHVFLLVFRQAPHPIFLEQSAGMIKFSVEKKLKDTLPPSSTQQTRAADFRRYRKMMTIIHYGYAKLYLTLGKGGIYVQTRQTDSC